MNLQSEIVRRLKDGGWSIKREGAKHTIWEHPNGAIFNVNHHPIRDFGDHRKKTMALITKLEKQCSQPPTPAPSVVSTPASGPKTR